MLLYFRDYVNDAMLSFCFRFHFVRMLSIARPELNGTQSTRLHSQPGFLSSQPEKRLPSREVGRRSTW